MNLILQLSHRYQRRDFDRWIQHHEKLPFRIYVPSHVANAFMVRQLYSVNEMMDSDNVHGLKLKVDQFLMHTFDNVRDLLQ